MTEQDAEAALAESDDLVSCTQGTIPDMKRLRDQCLAAGIAATVGCPDGKSCGTKIHLLVAEPDVPQVTQLLRAAWAGHLASEGTIEIMRARQEAIAKAIETDAEHLPCPACGTAAPLVDGACSDCGLSLE